MIGSRPRAAAARRHDRAVTSVQRAQGTGRPARPFDLDRWSELVVRVGANVQPGQQVVLEAPIEQRPAAVALATSAYRAGAAFVDVIFSDADVRRARAMHAGEEWLGHVPTWLNERYRRLAADEGAVIVIFPPAVTDALASVDARRVARLRGVTAFGEALNSGRVNWCAVAAPSEAWARALWPRSSVRQADVRLGEILVEAYGLADDDPVAAWEARRQALVRRADALNASGVVSLRFRDGATDLTMGLLPSSTWVSVADRTLGGIPFLANLPSREVYTAPDPSSVSGVVQGTRPAVVNGTVVEGFEIRFDAGRAVAVTAADRGRRNEGSASASGIPALEALFASDDTATRLGEVALVEDDGWLASADVSDFRHPLLDENATCHLALGNAYPRTYGEADRGRANTSAVHLDFMIGSGALDVTGTTADGRELGLLHRGRWSLGS